MNLLLRLLWLYLWMCICLIVGLFCFCCGWLLICFVCELWFGLVDFIGFVFCWVGCLLVWVFGLCGLLDLLGWLIGVFGIEYATCVVLNLCLKLVVCYMFLFDVFGWLSLFVVFDLLCWTIGFGMVGFLLFLMDLLLWILCLFSLRLVWIGDLCFIFVVLVWDAV